MDGHYIRNCEHRRTERLFDEQVDLGGWMVGTPHREHCETLVLEPRALRFWVCKLRRRTHAIGVQRRDAALALGCVTGPELDQRVRSEDMVAPAAV
jgi:hypothetical protein